MAPSTSLNPTKNLLSSSDQRLPNLTRTVSTCGGARPTSRHPRAGGDLFI
jgi:hypothetical protein